jgi:hypothetical protein
VSGSPITAPQVRSQFTRSACLSQCPILSLHTLLLPGAVRRFHRYVMLLNTYFDHIFNFPVGSYIASTAVAYGHSRNFALYLPAINNGVLLLGAIVFGFIGDLLGI